jgi:hypothetical protein
MLRIEEKYEGLQGLAQLPRTGLRPSPERPGPPESKRLSRGIMGRLCTHKRVPVLEGLGA